MMTETHNTEIRAIELERSPERAEYAAGDLHLIVEQTADSLGARLRRDAHMYDIYIPMADVLDLANRPVHLVQAALIALEARGEIGLEISLDEEEEPNNGPFWASVPDRDMETGTATVGIEPVLISHVYVI
jgi:hypothetical protein